MTCQTCGKDPARRNSFFNECSHVECPHRERAWSNGTWQHPAEREPTRKCPWCGLTVPESDDCPKPSDYCSHASDE